MKRLNIATVVLASSLILGACIVPAWAYFTDTTMATGGVKVSVGTDTEMREWYAEKQKHVSINNSAESANDVYVRARVYSSIGYAASGNNWSGPDGEGWYYYKNPVAPGSTIGKDNLADDELIVTITSPIFEEGEQPDLGIYYGENYNVIVYYESTPAFKNSEGGYEPANWDEIVSDGKEGGN